MSGSSSSRKDERRSLLPTSQQSQSPPTPTSIQRRSSNPLPGISATASSLRTRRAGTSSSHNPNSSSDIGSSSSINNKANSNSGGTLHLSDLDENDFDEETPGDFDPALNVKASRTPASLLRAALTPAKASDNSQSGAASNRTGASANPSSGVRLMQQQQQQQQQPPLSSSSSSARPPPPSAAASRFKGTPARATRYSLPVRAEKPVRTTKTSGKHIVLPSESQLAPLPGDEDDEDDDDDEDDSEDGSDSEEDDDDDDGGASEAGTAVPPSDGEQKIASSSAAIAAAKKAPEGGKVDAAKKPQLPSEPMLVGGRGAGHDLEAIAQIAKPPARKPVSAPRAGPTIPTARGRDLAPVPGKLMTPASTQGGRRPAASSSALARAAVSSLASAVSRGIMQKQKPTATFRATGVRAPPLKPLRSGPVYHTFERMAPSTRVMTPLPRLTAYSISSSIHLGTLLGFLRREHGVKPRLYDECAYALYTKPLLPGFGRANVRSAPEPRSASPGAESRRERELEEREEFGYVGTYFEHRGEEADDIDPDGYIQGGEGRGNESDSRHSHRHSRDGDGRDDGRRREGSETSAWESEAEKNHWSRGGDGGGSGGERNNQRKNGGGGGNLESETENEQSHDVYRQQRHRDGRDDSLEDADAPRHIPYQQHQRPLSGSSFEDGDEAMLATPLARPVAVERRDDSSDLEDGARRPFLLERKRSGSQSSSDVGETFSRSWRDEDQRRSNGSEMTDVEGEVTDPDTAGARDMLMQQLSEEIDGPLNVIASSSYRSTDTVLSAEMASEAEEVLSGLGGGGGSGSGGGIGRLGRHSRNNSEGSLSGDKGALDAIPEAESRALEQLTPLPSEMPGRLSPSRRTSSRDNLAIVHEDHGEQQLLLRASPPGRPGASRKKSKSRRKQRKRNKFTGPNMASHNHDTSANMLTPRPILEALRSAELIILPYGVLVMYNFTAAEERSIIEDVLSSGCAREIMAEEDRETEAFHFCYDPNIAAPRIFNDFFTFRAPNHLLKLSLAHAIAQSTKLSVFEERMQDSLEVTSHIPKEMASSGELKLKRREALRLTGRLFKLRVDVNLTSNVLDTPELFWSEASLKLLYDAIRDYLEIDERVENLNERLAVASDLLEIIHEHIANAAMSKITWIVIILIVVACAVAVGEISARFIVGANRSGEEKAFRAATRFMVQGRSTL